MMNNIGILDPAGININPLNNKPYSEEYKELAKKWSKFPAYQKAHEIIQAIKDNQVILITSGTGSGKTVLLPKFVLHTLDYNGRIAITLPKQIITQSASEFCAKTMDVVLGKQIGYKYKGSPKNMLSNETKILFATDGTIVAKLLNDPELKEYDAVLIDEAHERKVQIDFLLYLLKNTCKLRKNFKLVIMSATINEKIFSNYFDTFKFIHFDVGGKTNYPIESIFLDKPIDQKIYLEKGIEIINNILKTTKTGDILFFVTSIIETMDTCKKLSNNESFCVEVYAGMNEIQQELAQSDNMTNKRKLVIATNVAESSLTISNIKYVIDSGYELFGYYDPEKDSKVLTKKFISQAQVKQRMGRGGRTGPGVCYHLYTEDFYKNIFVKYPLPTIKTSDITGECLNLLNLNSINTIDNLKKVLNEFIEPPSEKYVNKSILILEQLGFIENNQINKLGKLVSDMQVEPKQGLAIYYAYHLNCAKEVIMIFSMIEAMKGNIGELFKIPESETNDFLLKKFIKTKKELTNKNIGDHLTLLHIYQKYIKLKNNKNNNKIDDWIYKYFIKKNILEKAQKNYRKIKNHVFSKINNDIKINNNDKLSIKIMTAIYAGYYHNTFYYKSSNQNIKLSNDSFLSFYNSRENLESKQLIYNEIITINDKITLSIVSKISEQCKKLFLSINTIINQ